MQLSDQHLTAAYLRSLALRVSSQNVEQTCKTVLQFCESGNPYFLSATLTPLLQSLVSLDASNLLEAPQALLCRNILSSLDLRHSSATSSKVWLQLSNSFKGLADHKLFVSLHKYLKFSKPQVLLFLVASSPSKSSRDFISEFFSQAHISEAVSIRPQVLEDLLVVFEDSSKSLHKQVSDFLFSLSSKASESLSTSSFDQEVSGAMVSLSSIVRDVGYAATSSVNAFMDIAQKAGHPQIKDTAAASVLAMMMDTTVGLKSDAVNKTWRPEVVAAVLKSAYLDVGAILRQLDIPEASFNSPASLAFLMQVAKSMGKPKLPVRPLAANWENSRAQLALLVHVVKTMPDAIDTRGSGKLVKWPGAENSAAGQLWSSVDLVFRLGVLAEKSAQNGIVQDLFEDASRRHADCFFASALSCPAPTPAIISEAISHRLSQLVDAFPTSAGSFRALWQAVPSPLCLAFAKSYSRGSITVKSVLNVALALQDVNGVLSHSPASFAAELAIIAGAQEHLNMHKWIRSSLDVRSDADSLANSLAKCIHKSISLPTDPLPATAAIGVFDALAASAKLSAQCKEEVANVRTQCAKVIPGLEVSGSQASSADQQQSNAAGSGEIFSKEVEDASNANFRKIYNSKLSIDEAIRMIYSLRTSDVKHNKDVFAHMVHSLFQEYRYFVEYPDQELSISGQLFGGLINNHVFPTITQKTAINNVLDALKKDPSKSQQDARMFKFGIVALDRFQRRLPEMGEFCMNVTKISHAQQNLPSELWTAVQSSARGPNASQGAGVLPSRAVSDPTGSKPIAHLPQGIVTPGRAGASMEMHSTPSHGQQESAVDSSVFAPANTDVLTSQGRHVSVPSDSVQDKIHFIFNNLSQKNLDEKKSELEEFLTPELIPYISQYIVTKRIALEPNFHALYILFFEKVGMDVLYDELLAGTLDAIRVLLRLPNITKVSQDRILLKNLGSWFGTITLARNKPILFEHLDLKNLLIRAAYDGKLVAVVPFVSKIMESVRQSKAFKPPNPWTLAILRIMQELQSLKDLKININFEIELLFKKIGTEVSSIKPSALIVPSRIQKENNPDFNVKDLPSSRGSISEESATGQSASGAGAPGVVIPSGIDIFNQNPGLKSLVSSCVQLGIKDVLPGVIDRSVRIALITTRELLMKDFAYESDDNVRRAAHLTVRNLAGSLALVSCKDPLRGTIKSHLKMRLQDFMRTVDAAYLERVCQTTANENVEVGALLIEKQAVDLATRQIDESLNRLVQERRKRGNVNQPMLMTEKTLLQPLDMLPESLRPPKSGLQPAQMSIYEDFDRLPKPIVTPGAMRDVSNVSAPMGAGASKLASVPTSAAIESSSSAGQSMIGDQEAKLSIKEALDQCNSLVSSAENSIIDKGVAGSQEVSTVATKAKRTLDACENSDEAAVAFGNALIRRLFQSSAQQHSGISSLTVAMLVICKNQCSRVVTEITGWLLGNEGRAHLSSHSDVVHSLIRSDVVKIAEVEAALKDEAAQPRVSQEEAARAAEAAGARILQAVRQRNVEQAAAITIDEWQSLVRGNSSDTVLGAFITQVQRAGVLNVDEVTESFFTAATEYVLSNGATKLAAQDGHPYDSITALAKLILVLSQLFVDPSKGGLVAGVVAKSCARAAQREAVQKGASFDQRPYHRLLIDLCTHLTQNPSHQSDPSREQYQYLALHAVATVLHHLQPSVVPAFAFAWLEVFAHKCFLPRLLLIREQKGWPLVHGLLIDQLSFLEPHLRSGDLSDPIGTMYKGTLRVLLVLLHDFPEFVSENHATLLDAIPIQALQLRNLVLSAFPRYVRPPDPFTQNLKVDMLPDIGKSPTIKMDVAKILGNLRTDLDGWLQSGRMEKVDSLPVRLLQQNAALVQRFGTRYNVPLINALVLHICVTDINTQQQQQGKVGAVTASPAPMALVRRLLAILDAEGRYLILSAVANQLRYPNSHTHYCSCLLLNIFSDFKPDNGLLQEQITRVLMERLVVNKPHPWGLLITFIELIRNSRFEFWRHDFVRAAKEIEVLFQGVARNCLPPQQAAAVMHMFADAGGHSSGLQ